MLTSNSDGIRIEGHRGTWYVIDMDTTRRAGTAHPALFLLEHELAGDQAACLIVDDSGHIVLDDVWNGFADLDELEPLTVEKYAATVSLTTKAFLESGLAYDEACAQAAASVARAYYMQE